MKLRIHFFIFFFLLLAGILVPTFLFLVTAAESGIRVYVYQGDVEKAKAFAPLIEREFERTPHWDALRPLFQEPPFSIPAPHFEGPAKGAHSHLAAGNVQERLIILNLDRVVVLDSKSVLEGSTHPAEHLHDAVPITSKQGNQLGYLLVGTMVDPALGRTHEEFLRTTLITLTLAFVGGLILAFPVSFFAASRISKPIATLALSARKAGSGHWEIPALLGSPDEVQQLMSDFSALSQKLKASEEAKARILADTAHELRTPLFLLQGTLEGMIDGVFPLTKESLEPLFQETLRLGKLVEDLRNLEDLLETEHYPRSFLWEPLIERAEALFEAAFQEKKITFQVHKGLTQNPGWGNPDQVFQILENLLSNALRYAQTDGKISLTLVTEPHKNVITVDDDGLGVPAEMRTKVFERLVRLDTSRSSKTGGRGLGLAIVHKIVMRHGGQIKIQDSPWGGASFVLELPLQA